MEKENIPAASDDGEGKVVDTQATEAAEVADAPVDETLAAADQPEQA